MKPVIGAGITLVVLIAAFYGIRLYAFQQQDVPRPLTPAPAEQSVAAFEPSSPAIVKEILKMAEVTNRDVVYDLGSGDGRIVIAAALAGARAVGVDIDRNLIRQSRINAEKAHVAGLVQFLHQDLYKTPVGSATVVTLYLTPEGNLMLRQRLLAELKPGSRVVSHSHDMGDWKPDHESIVDQHHIYSWVIPADLSGSWKLDVMDKYAGNDYTLRITQRFQSVKIVFQAGRNNLIVSQVHLTGKKLRFTIQGQIGSLADAEFSGEVEGNLITGKFTSKKDAGVWTARRIRDKKTD